MQFELCKFEISITHFQHVDHVVFEASRGTPAALATGEWQLRFVIQVPSFQYFTPSHVALCIMWYVRWHVT